VALGGLLAGPLLCGTSQAVNDWFDRHVDAINEPDRVIPSGRMPGRWGLGVAIVNSVLSMVVAALLGMTVFMSPQPSGWRSPGPIRHRRSGSSATAGGAIRPADFPMRPCPGSPPQPPRFGTVPSGEIFIIAFLYGLGALGIMTLNDFKSMEGDTRMGIASLPVQMGAKAAAKFAGLSMIVPQLVVVGAAVGVEPCLVCRGRRRAGLAQAVALPRLVADPKGKAIWYSALGVGLYVTGMMITAFAIRP
jgi:chlorophyll synthase